MEERRFDESFTGLSCSFDDLRKNLTLFRATKVVSLKFTKKKKRGGGGMFWEKNGMTKNLNWEGRSSPRKEQGRCIFRSPFLLWIFFMCPHHFPLEIDFPCFAYACSPNGVPARLPSSVQRILCRRHSRSKSFSPGH